ncbi:GNAT family N-acetyltransferase [Acidobacterium sp. S8]|uniref:GNAT family N-acetyltransferase n=1 Tax=Acidobacterium sp. S8 TaxID=1641854 RepID=UPI00131C3476|nr:GNAT family N-acetyltransferase [Acidobacterium sp. S8]
MITTLDSHIDPGLLHDEDLVLKFSRYEPHKFFLVPAYHFLMVHADTSEEMGRINLRAETNSTIERFSGHIGYAVHEPYRGRRYAARSVRLLLPLARQLDIAPLWITCDPDNAASRRSCELAGAEFVDIVNLPPTYGGYALGQRQKCRYRLLA